MKLWQKILLLWALLFMIITYNLIWYLGLGEEYLWEKLVFVSIAWAIASLSYLVMILVKEKDYAAYRIANVFTWLAVANLMDELFFDPTEFNVWEYVFASLVIVINVVKYVNYRKANKSKWNINGTNST